jgi:4-amino-4-deoxy-L-arabinose transferase-like glycosyltransferase
MVAVKYSQRIPCVLPLVPAKFVAMPNRSRSWLGLLCVALVLAACVGIVGRGYWTPDEPREADIAWRMSWQADKAVPLLAGEAFCEKPPLAYWAAGAAIHVMGADAWVARLPNLLYALITALAVASIGRRSAGPIAGLVAAAAISTFLLAYQVAIWLATDAPLLAAVAVALLGLYIGFYADRTGDRLRGYSCMHTALALGFLSKSAAAWMVPALTFVTLVIWERRWRELLRWELYVGLGLQAALILTWIGFVYTGPEGAAHLKVFFWNNLVGRFTHVDAPEALQYAAAHRNSPGKYLIELPVYLWPWDLLVVAAARRIWRQRHASVDELRPVRFALATFVPTLGVLSVAATARNIYLAPALPGIALLLGWWASNLLSAYDHWDSRAMRGTSVLLLLATLIFAGAVVLIGWDSWDASKARGVFVAVSVLGLLAGAGFAMSAWRAARRGLVLRGLVALLLGYCALLVGPASQIYRRVDRWQDLGMIGRAIGRDTAGRSVILYSPDETTRAFIDMYARTSVELIRGPPTAGSAEHLQERLAELPQSLVVSQLPGRNESRAFHEFTDGLRLLRRPAPAPSPDADQMPVWASNSHLRMVRLYALPNGRRYALFESSRSTASR